MEACASSWHPTTPIHLFDFMNYFEASDTKLAQSTGSPVQPQIFLSTWPAGLLHPLPTPSGPWQAMSMGFIMDLPNSRWNTSILVKVGLLTRMAHFIPSIGLPTACETAQLYLQNIFHLHGLPDHLVLPLARNLSTLVISSSPPIRWADKMNQHYLGTIPQVLCKPPAGQLVSPTTLGWIHI